MLAWIVFHIFVLVMLALDLLVAHRKAHEISMREAVGWSILWTVIALLFNAGIYFRQGPAAGLNFFTGYLLERSLSVDNLFVFFLIFNYFKVPGAYQYKILFWGILGALFMRAGFIVGGVALIHRFHWVVYVLGAVLVVSGIKLFSEKEKEVHPEKNIMIKLFRFLMPVTAEYRKDRFFVLELGRLMATPLFVVLLVVESTDLVFAVDSVPAILAITTDPFIVYTSNILAILGMRALYFVLAGSIEMFRYLHYGLGAVLVFIGLKMILAEIFKIPIFVALGVIATIVVGSIVLSLLPVGRAK